MLAVYGVFAAYAYGLLMNLSGWPFLLGIVVPGHEQTALSFDPQAPLTENLSRFAAYSLITSTGSFDTGRAITNAVAIVVVGPAVLTTLRRAARRATVVGHVARPVTIWAVATAQIVRFPGTRVNQPAASRPSG